MHECPECGEVCGCDDDDVMQEGLYLECGHDRDDPEEPDVEWDDDEDEIGYHVFLTRDEHEMRYDEEE